MERMEAEQGNERVDLRGANLFKANLRWSHLYRADLSRANLTVAQLVKTDLRGASLAGSMVYGGAVWDITVDAQTKQNDLVIADHQQGVLTLGSGAGLGLKAPEKGGSECRARLSNDLRARHSGPIP